VENTARVWFVGQTGNYLAWLNPQTGEFQRYELERGTLPHNLVVDEAGQVWYAGNGAAHIGRLDPESSKIAHYAMPDPEAADPHTLVFDPAGEYIWFTVQGGNFIGRLRIAMGNIDLIPVTTPNARPYGIVTTPDGTPWVALFGTHRLAAVDPETLTLSEIELPRPETRPRRLASTKDGAIWYVDNAGGFLGRYQPADGQFREWRMPGGERARPYAMAADDADRVWFVETGAYPNRLVGFDPVREQFFAITAIPSGAGAVRHMVYDRATRSLWFGTDANTIGRALVE
jgi:virginiamycin B lyase